MNALTVEEKEMLVSLLISSDIGKDLVANEITDIELGVKKLENATYKKLIELYDKIS